MIPALWLVLVSAFTAYLLALPCTVGLFIAWIFLEVLCMGLILIGVLYACTLEPSAFVSLAGMAFVLTALVSLHPRTPTGVQVLALLVWATIGVVSALLHELQSPSRL